MDAIWYDLGRHADDYEAQVTLLTLAGLVNRQGPRLMLDTDFQPDWTGADRRWRQIYSEKHGITFRDCQSLAELLQTFEVAGRVTYDPDLDASRWVAVTIATLRGWLPVPASKAPDELYDLPETEDLCGRWARGQDAYDWAIAELLPLCSKSLAFEAGHSYNDVNLGHDMGVHLALDYAVRERCFAFNLSPCPTEDSYDHEKEKVSAYPEHVETMRRIMAEMDPMAGVVGWAEPEWTLIERLSEWGHYLICGRAQNLSFHASVPAKGGKLRQKAIAKSVSGEGLTPAAVMVSEGDAPRVLTSFYGGAWEHPKRGSIPVNWGINPLFAEMFPAMYAYYFDTASENDYFYAGTSGAGYTLIDELPEEGLLAFAERTAKYCRLSDISVIHAWDKTEAVRQRYDVYGRIAKPAMFVVLPREDAKNVRLPCGIPMTIPDSELHYKSVGPEDTPGYMRQAMEKRPTAFRIIYTSPGATFMQRWTATADAMEELGVRPVLLPEIARLAAGQAESE